VDLERAKAVDLPDDTVVAFGSTVWIRNHPSKRTQWRGTNGGHFDDAYIDDRLADGAVVLRLGPEVK
jgi:hypothetical protein